MSIRKNSADKGMEKWCEGVEVDTAIILDYISDGFFVLDKEMVVTCFNGAAERYLQKSAADVLGQPLFDVFPEARNSIFETKYREVMETRHPTAFETWFDTPPYRNWYEVRVFPCRKGITVCFQVTTERREAEAALYESEEWFRILFEEAPDAIFIEALDDRILDTNAAASRMLGYSREEFRSMTVADLQAPEVRGEEGNILRKELAQGAFFEGLDIRKDGTRIPVEVNNSRMHVRNQELVLSIVRDISDRKQVEEELTQIFRMSLDLISIADINTATFKRVNPAFTTVLGYSEEELLGRPFLDFVHPDDIEATTRSLEEKLKTGSSVFHFLNRYRQKSGGYRWLSWVSHPLPEKGVTYSIARDVTEQKRAQRELVRLNTELAEKNTELEQVVYVASHDLRSPLVNIAGYSKELAYAVEDLRRVLDQVSAAPEAEKALAPILDEDIPEALHFIRTSASKMDALLMGLLRLSRSGRGALKIEPLDMNELITRVIDSTDFQFREGGITLNVSDLPPCRGDAVQVNQVFSNLLDNARKYLDPRRQGIIRISGTIEGERSVYCIEDNGVGIAPGHLDKIFEIFHRLDPSRGSGEGLGLTIVRRILGRLGGDIRVESEIGTGSRFCVSLPTGETEK